MPHFDRKNFKMLKDYIFNNYYDHDAVMKRLCYDPSNDTIIIDLYNPTYRVEITILFRGVVLFYMSKSTERENQNVVNILTVSEDLSLIENKLIQHDAKVNELLYLIFEMISADEIHILSREITITVTQIGDKGTNLLPPDEDNKTD